LICIFKLDLIHYDYDISESANIPIVAFADNLIPDYIGALQYLSLVDPDPTLTGRLYI
jgi:hypothetical protein